MIIPHLELNPDTLQNLIEDFVTREGTDYGEIEISLKSKVDCVLQQLNNKTAYLSFDTESQTIQIVLPEKGLI